EVDVDAAVPIEVARGDAHPVTARVDAALIGDVREMERAGAVRIDLQVVAEESRLERRRAGRLNFGDVAYPEHVSLRKQHVEIAVVVIVEEGDAARQPFRVVPAAGAPAG